MGKIEGPCFNCEARTKPAEQDCHGTCIKYQKYKQELESQRRARKAFIEQSYYLGPRRKV